MFVGEQPGDEEDKSGIPFIGPAGQLLNQVLSNCGIERNSIYITNAVKHFKWLPRGKRRLHQRPNGSEILACKPWLNAEIDLVKPSVIVCLGATAAQSVLGLKIAVNQSQNQTFKGPGDVPVLVTFHPSAALRSGTEDRCSEIIEAMENVLMKCKKYESNNINEMNS